MNNVFNAVKGLRKESVCVYVLEAYVVKGSVFLENGAYNNVSPQIRVDSSNEGEIEEFTVQCLRGVGGIVSEGGAGGGLVNICKC